jgi:hypothetical protein
MDSNQWNFIDFVSLLSFALGHENLMENREQSRQNDVQSANDVQAQFLIKKLGEKFEEQNKKLDEILEAVKK